MEPSDNRHFNGPERALDLLPRHAPLEIYLGPVRMVWADTPDDAGILLEESGVITEESSEFEVKRFGHGY